DCGMCGDYDSVIGMQKEVAVARFVNKVPGERLKAADGEGTLCAVFVVTDDATGLARRIEPVRLGGRLREHVPRIAAPFAGVPPMSNPFVGTWTLRSTERKSLDTGEVTPLWGQHPSGTLIYTAEGRMSALVLAENRRAPAAPMPTEAE